MATLSNTSRNSATPTNVTRSVGDAVVFYAWMFLFTIPQFTRVLTNTAQNDASLINVAKS